uniref:uncharacterized protein LOC120333795 n=1 Tax=Styela clava TaxID=7725 RepID=UPI0019399DB5|nr:uncharacterized protein LOC120333795 [Styela clava]XP_039257102.1 uncharacterized protein LOC120333795 [Styela clava]
MVLPLAKLQYIRISDSKEDCQIQGIMARNTDYEKQDNRNNFESGSGNSSPIQRLSPVMQNTPQLLSPPANPNQQRQRSQRHLRNQQLYQSLSVDEKSPTLPKKSSFGNFLDVPTSPREPLSLQSASISTDEGIVTDELAPHQTQCYQNDRQPIEAPEYSTTMGLPGVFCACCYNHTVRQFFRSAAPAAIPVTTFFEEKPRKLCRIKSEDVPRRRPPLSNGWQQQQTIQTDDIQRQQHQRMTFEGRGHSISDAQVRYRPESKEFIGIKQYKHRRKLPRIPNVDSFDGRLPEDAAPPQRQISKVNSSDREINKKEAPKPRLQRQRRQCVDSFDDCNTEALNKSPTPSVRFRKNSLSPTLDRKTRKGRVNSEERDTNPCQSKDKPQTKPKSSNTLSPGGVQTYAYLNGSNVSSSYMANHRAKSMDCERRVPIAQATPLQSKSFEERRNYDVINLENYENDSDIRRSSSSTQVTTLADDKNTTSSNETFSNKNTTKPQRSIAERLMLIGPTDQRRVQGIVQDVLVEMGEERILQYKSAFAKFDKDSSGIISSKQLRRLLRTLGHNPGDDELRELVNQVDMDENGKIDFNEFIIMIGHFDKSNNTSEDLSHIFRVYDESTGGSINVGELRTICSEYLVESVPLENINEMIDFIDRDGDGEINRDELCRVWSNRW